VESALSNLNLRFDSSFDYRFDWLAVDVHGINSGHTSSTDLTFWSESSRLPRFACVSSILDNPLRPPDAHNYERSITQKWY